MKVAFIHNEKKIGTGAHYINDLMSSKLHEAGVETKNFYPKTSITDTPVHLGGIKSILFFYSLLERRKEILKFNLIQGTTYTALPFLAYPVPVVCHFGSTTRGFLNSTPFAIKLENGCKKIWYRLKKENAISELNLRTRKPLRDIADVESYVAARAAAVIATSEMVRNELLAQGVSPSRVHLIHNAIEDYWFDNSSHVLTEKPHIVFLGRLGSDVFTLKLKGVDRMIHLFQKFPEVEKTSFCMTTNKPLVAWLRSMIPNHYLYQNIKKDKLPEMLRSLCGSILFIPSRYEGFSLSLIEGMSQGLIPVIYSVGVAPEIIKNGENGFVVASQSEAIEKINLILSDRTLRAKMSLASIQTSKQFTSSVISKNLMELYQQVISNNHQAGRQNRNSH